MEKIEEENKIKKFTIENILCVFIILCPILDIVSFLFRNAFDTSISPSTFIRPIIPAIVIIYLFIKEDKKFKRNVFIIGIIYLIYGIIHLYVFNSLRTESSYGNLIHEAQYLINYSYMILNLFIYIYIFKDRDTKKLRNSVIISILIYIISIFISILTNTSSPTYIEGIGKKGWFESGNSIGTILILSLYIYIPLIKDRKYKKIVIPLVILLGIFLTMFLGTRVGLYGFILVLASYVFVEIIYKIITKAKINKKVIAICIFGICAVMLVVITIGSTTLQRRQHLKNIEGNIVDENIHGQAHVTGSILEIKNNIDEGNIPNEYMTPEQQKSILELYDICNKFDVKNNDQRMQQLIYNASLVKNQKNPLAIIFGNGYLNNFRELVMEMEIPAFLFNFGIIGFILYFIPFLAIFIYALYIGIKNIKKIDDEYLTLFIGAGFVFAISFFAGYTFFNSSTMMIIIVINTMLINKIQLLKKEENK